MLLGALSAGTITYLPWIVDIELHIEIDNGGRLTKQYSSITSIWNLHFTTCRLKSSLQTFYGRHHNLVDLYEISISQITMDL